jgi:hypothetical protein
VKKQLTMSRRGFLGTIAASIPMSSLLSAPSLTGCATNEEPDPEADDAALTTCGPTFDLKVDFHAKGDGETNDTGAFQAAAQAIQDAGCGKLKIPPGIYIVGRQTKKTDPDYAGQINPPARPFYAKEEIFTVKNLSSLGIFGAGAIIRVANGLHYGGFDSETGAPKDALDAETDGPRDPDQAAMVGRIFDITACDYVVISGVELDGNSPNLVLGRKWGDKDRQCQAIGIRLTECSDATVKDVYTHHHGLDGISVGNGQTMPLVKKPHRLIRVVSEYNGRQGLSGFGWGLEATDCKFNHTGRAINRGGGIDSGLPLSSAPSAGVDIEPNQGSMARDGVFTGCEFINNAGAGLDANNGDGGYSTFEDCTFWGTTSWSIWAVLPGLKFSRCRIYGSAVHLSDGSSHFGTLTGPDPTLATAFEECTFEDKPWTDDASRGSPQRGRVYRNGYLFSGSSTGASFSACTFIAHKMRSVQMRDETTREIFNNCTFRHGYSDLADESFQASFGGSRIRSCQFEESAAIASGDKTYYISVTNVVVAPPAPGDSPTHASDHVRWGSVNGPSGEVPPKTYP